jgi:hypothetical protein
MSTTVSTYYDLIESAAGGNVNDFRQLMQSLVADSTKALEATGNQAGQSTANVAAPPKPGFSVAGENAAYTITITPAQTNVSGAQWFEVSYSTVKGFTSGITTLPATQSTSMVLNLANQSLFFRVRASRNKTTWSDYVLAAQTASNAGLVGSAITSEGGAFNQTNFAIVNSVATGSTAAVSVSGPSGALTSFTRVKGTAQQVRPAATIIGVTPGTDQFVGWDGSTYVLRPTLASVLSDNLEPVGKVSVVSTAAPTLPVISPVVVSGYIVGFNVVSGGAGASQPYVLTFGSVGGGVGATFGAQTIQNGVLISVAAGNPGNGSYSGGTTVTASGGSGGGQAGGGTAIGGNGGRLSAV